MQCISALGRSVSVKKATKEKPKRDASEDHSRERHCTLARTADGRQGFAVDLTRSVSGIMSRSNISFTFKMSHLHSDLHGLAACIHEQNVLAYPRPMGTQLCDRGLQQKQVCHRAAWATPVEVVCVH